MATYDYVTDHAQTVTLDEYNSGDQINFKDLNGGLVDFDYEKNGDNVVLSTDVQFYAKINITPNGEATPYISDAGGHYEVATGEHTAILTLATVGAGAGYYWWRLEDAYGEFDGEKHYGMFGIDGASFHFDEAGNVTSIDPDTFSGLTYEFTGFYEVVNGGDPIDVTKGFYELVKDVDSVETMSAAHEKLYNAEHGDITVTLDDYATVAKEDTDIYVNGGEETGTNLAEVSYAVEADGNYEASWLNENITVVDDSVISARYEGDSVFFKDLNGNNMAYSLSTDGTDATMTANVQYYATIKITPNGEATPYISDAGGHYEVATGEHRAYLALSTSGAGAGYYWWRLEPAYGEFEDGPRYGQFGIDGASFNFDEEGNVTSIDPDTFSGLTYEFTGFYEVVNGGDPIDVTKGFYELVKDVDSVETMSAAHEKLFNSQGDLTATLDDYATVVYQGADVYANGTDNLSEATYAVNADGSYTATWLKEEIAVSGENDTTIIFNETTAAGDSLVFGLGAELSYSRDGNNLVITNSASETPVTTTVKDYYTTYRMEDAGQFADVEIGETTLGELNVTNIESSFIKGTNAAETITLDKIGEAEVLPQPEGNDFPNYNTTTGEYKSNATGETVKVESYTYANGGNDTVYGTDGNDWINGGAGNDEIFAGEDGYDMLTGEAGDDIIIAGKLVAEATETSKAYVIGGKTYNIEVSTGRAELYGGAGNDTLIASKGDDYISGGAGINTMTGNGGADLFVVSGTNDVITDAASDDVIAIIGTASSKNFEDVSFARGAENSTSLFITYAGGTKTLELQNYFKYDAEADAYVMNDDAAKDFVLVGNDGQAEYTLEWKYSNVDREYHMYNVTHNPDGAAVEGIRNWINGYYNGNLEIEGANAGDMLAGSLGKDTITASAGASELYGDEGDDTLIGGAGADYIRGNAGDDILTGNGGNDIFAIESGNDVITDAKAGDIIKFVDAVRDDFTGITFEKDGTSLKISYGDDATASVEGYFDAEGKVVADHVNTFALATSEGTKTYTLEWKSSNNPLFADGETAYEGMYNVIAGTGNEDTVVGDDTFEMIHSVPGIPNWINGGDGEQYIFANNEKDMLAGNDGDDFITAGGKDGAVEIYGGAGDDELHGGNGNDWIAGNEGKDDIYGGDGDDYLFGGDHTAEADPDGKDMIWGGAGDDHIYGRGGNDILLGQEGDDYINGGTGDDTLSGGAGADTFFFAKGDGKDLISDATSADVIKFSTAEGKAVSFADMSFARSETTENALEITYGDGDVITVAGYFAEDADRVTKFNVGGQEYTLEWKYSNVDREYHMYNVTHNPDGAAVEGIRNWINGYYNGNVNITGKSAGDMLAGSIKNDKIDASDGGSELYGDAGNDLLIGGAGNDYIQGGSGDDDLYGYGGNDKLITNDGTDKAYGGSGDDHFFIDGAGTKTIEGEEGADTYHIIDLSAVSNITADADDNITFDYSNYKFSDLKFTRDGSDLVISFEKTDNTGKVNVKGFFTAESKIDTINALNDENTPELTAYSILNNADIYVDLTEVNGAYEATDYREVFYGEGTVNGFNNAKDSVESASPVLTRTNNSADLVIDNITITDFDFDTMHPFAIRNGVESQSSTYFPINVTLTNDTEYQATGYAEKINGVGSVNLAGEHPFDRSQDSIVVADVDDVKFTREDNGYLHVELGGTDIAVKGFNFAGGTDFNVADAEETILTAGQTIDVTLTGALEGSYVSASGYPERITTVGSSAIQFYPEGQYTGKDTLVFAENAELSYSRDGNDLVIINGDPDEGAVITTVVDYYTSGDMSERGQFYNVDIQVGTLEPITLASVEKVTDIEGVSYFDSGIWSTDRDETVVLTEGLTTAAAIDPEKLAADSEGTVTVGTGDHAGKYVFTSNAGHGTHELDSYALGRAGDDYIFGTDGNDWIHGGAGDDIISGGTAGHDMLAGGDGKNYIVAGDFVGTEMVLNKDGVEIYGGSGIDAIHAGGDDDTQNYIWAHGGDDIIRLEGGQNTIMLVEDDRSSAGNDTISGASALDTLKFVSRDGNGDVISGYNFADLTFTKDGDDLIITTPNDNTVTIAEFFTATSKVDIVKTADRVDAHSIKSDVVFDVVVDDDGFDKATSPYAGYRVNIQLADGTESASVSGLGEGDNIDIPANFTLSRTYSATNTTNNNVLKINDGLINITGYNFDSTPAFTIASVIIDIGAPLDVELFDDAAYTTTNAFSESIHGFGSVLATDIATGKNDKIVTSDGATVEYSRTDARDLVVSARKGGIKYDQIEVTGFVWDGAHDVKVNNGTTAGMTVNVELTGALDGPYNATVYAENITTTGSSMVQFAAGTFAGDKLVFNTESENVYLERVGNDMVITNSDDVEHPVITTVKDYYTSGDMSVVSPLASIGLVAEDATSTLGDIPVTEISGVSYFDSGIDVTNRAETVELTTGLEVGDIDPDKLALDTAGKVRINTTTEKYEYTSSAGYGTVALDAYAMGRAGEDTITGTAGNDWINGGADDDAVFGGAGAAGSHDMLSGHDGDDLVVAGEIVEKGTPGAINIGTPDDPQYVLLSDGNAEMYGGIGNDILFGGNANDYLDGGEGNDILYGNGGDDKLISDAGDDEMYGGEGDDKFFIDGAGTKTVEGGDGNDTFNIIDTNAVVTIADATSADKISFAYLNNIGFNNLDFAQAENEKDLVISYKNILGATGKVVVEGYFDQAEANRITTFNVKGTEYTLKWLHSNTTAIGDAMYNVTVNPDGATVEGIRNWVSGPTNESVTIVGKDQYDMLAGGQKDDIITAGENSNGAELYGDAGDDILTGGAGNDYIQGDGNYVPVGGNDILYGMGGDDKLITDDGNDEVYGGDGDDQIIINGEGTKYVEGGDGKDTYNIIDLTANVEIADAEAADTLSFHHKHYEFSNLSFTRLGDNLIITFAGMEDNGSIFVDDFFKSETPIDKVVAYDKNGVEQTYSILEDAIINVDLDQFGGETYTATDYTELFTATEPASVKGLKEDDIILNGYETEFTRANGGPLVINNLITVEDFFTTGLDVDFTVNGESTEDANIAVTLSDGFVYNSTRYDETIGGNGYVMGMEDGDKLAIDGEVEYSRINGGGLTVSGFTGELLNDKITVMDFAFINDGEHDINVNDGTTANATIKVTIKNDYTYDATTYPEVISGEGFVKGMTADDSIVDGTEPAVFSRFNEGGLIINDNLTVLDFFENDVDFKVNGVSTEHANIGVVLTDYAYTATRYAETISGTGSVAGLGDNDKLVVDAVSYERTNNGGLVVGGAITVNDFDFTGGHDINVNDGTTAGMTIDVTLTGILGAPYISASGYAERITTVDSTAIQFYPEGQYTGKDTLVFADGAELSYSRNGDDLVIANGDVVTTVLDYYTSGDMSVKGQFYNVGIQVGTLLPTTLANIEKVTDISNVSYFDSGIDVTDRDETVNLTTGLTKDAAIDPAKLVLDTDGKVKLNGDKYEFTSNVGYGKHDLDSYALGRAGEDTINGTAGNDWIHGGADGDAVFGGVNAAGHDMLAGGLGDDLVVAGELATSTTEGAVKVAEGKYAVLSNGTAELYGDAGDDTLVGGKGNDYLWGGAGHNTLTGNGGADTFDFTAREGGVFDTITDATKDDTIAIYGPHFKDMTFERGTGEHENDLIITVVGEGEGIGTGDTLTVKNYFATAEANRVTKFQVGGELYTLKWLADGDGNYAMYNYTDDPTKLVDGIQNWIEDEDPIDPESGIGTLVPGKDKRDVIYGTEYKDIISAGEGGAEIYGLEGDDFIYGSEKDDYIAGGEGNDSIYLDGAYAGGSDVIALVNPEGTLKAIGEDTIYGATANTTLLFSLGDGNGYKFNELEFNRVGNNLEIIAGTANDNPNKVIIDGFFLPTDSRVNAIHALDANGEEDLFSIYMDAEINVDLSQFEGTYHATVFDEVFTGSGSVEGMDKDYDRIVVDGAPVYTRTDNGGLTISTYSVDGLLVNEITVEDFNFDGDHDITVNNGTTEGMTIGVTLTDALDDTYIAAAYAENITVTAENPVNVRGLAAGDNLAIGNDGFKFSRVFVGDDSGNDDILTITTADGSKVVNVEAYDFTATPAFTIGNTPIMIDAPLDVTAKADYACSNAFSETVLVDGVITVAGFDTEKDALLFNEDAETTYALDKFAGLTISDGEGHSVTIEGIDTEADIIPANVGTFDDYEEDCFGWKTLKVSGYSEYDGTNTEFDSLDITGTLGSDTLKGSAGNDIIDGLADNDILTGGKGADTFVISAGTDDITDANAEDDIKFAGTYEGLEATAMETSLLIQSKDKDGNVIAVEIENYFDENGKVVADAVDTLYALNKQGEYAQYSISDIINKETYIDLTNYNFDELRFERNVAGDKPGALVIYADGVLGAVYSNDTYFTDKKPEDNIRTKDGKFSVLADAEIFVTQGEDGYTGTKYNETINTGTDNQTFDMKTGVDKLNFTFEECDTEEKPDFVMGDFIVKVTSGEQMFLNVPDTITVGATTFDVLQEFTVEGKDLVINVRYNSNEFIVGADPEYEHLGSITVKDAAGKNTGADIFVRNDGVFENVNDHPFIEFTEAEVTDKNTLTGSTLADNIDVSHYITENGKGVKIDSKSGNDVIVGSQYNDTVKASSLAGEFATVTEYGGTNKITTGNGNDIIEAKDYSSNTINAGAGNNIITLSSVGKNTVTAKDGRNLIMIDDGSNNVKVGKGNNMFDINAGTNTIKTGAGENAFFIDNGVNKITTGKKQDRFYIEGGNNTISSGAGEDRYVIEGGSNTIKTGNAASWFYLAERADENDTVYVNNITSGSKDDTFIISDGQNNLKGGSGADKFYIGYSADPITANPVRDDAVNGGYNVINGGAGDDVFFINSGKSALNGAKGNDRYEVDLTDFNFNAGQIVVTDTAGKNILNAAVDSTDGVLDTLNVFFDVAVKTNKSGTKFKGASYSDMTFTTDVADADGFDDLNGIDVSSKKAFTTINTYDGEGVSHSATISTKELDKLASDVASWMFGKGYASTDDVFLRGSDEDVATLIGKYTAFSANDYKMPQ